MTKKRAGRRDERALYQRLQLHQLYVSLGMVLAIAGGSKLYESAVAIEPDSPSTLVPLVLYEAELMGGVWLLFSGRRDEARLWLLAVFGGLWLACLWHGITGICSCRCFGGLAVSPWLVGIFDLVVLALLLKWRRPDGAGLEELPLPTVFGIGLVAFAIAIAAAWQQPRVSVAGMATRAGKPLSQALLVFTGGPVRFEVTTDERGTFRSPPVPPGPYGVSLSRATAPQPAHTLGRTTPSQPNGAGPAPRQQTNPGQNVSGFIAVEILECATDSLTVEFK